MWSFLCLVFQKDDHADSFEVVLRKLILSEKRSNLWTFLLFYFHKHAVFIEVS